MKYCILTVMLLLSIVGCTDSAPNTGPVVTAVENETDAHDTGTIEYHNAPLPAPEGYTVYQDDILYRTENTEHPKLTAKRGVTEEVAGYSPACDDVIKEEYDTKVNLWPNGKVYYYFAHRSAGNGYWGWAFYDEDVRKAMDVWERYANIEFIDITGEETDPKWANTPVIPIVNKRFDDPATGSDYPGSRIGQSSIGLKKRANGTRFFDGELSISVSNLTQHSREFPSYKEDRGITTIGGYDQAYNTALHVLGHALGLGHENLHPEVSSVADLVSQDDLTLRCSAYADWEYNVNYENDNYSNVDFSSIMFMKPSVGTYIPKTSYLDAHPDVRTAYEAGGLGLGYDLSEKDKEFIQELYGAPDHWDDIDQRTWSSGWDVIKTYTVGSSNFILLMKSSTGYAYIHRLNEDGTIGEGTYSKTWTPGWTHFEPYIIGGTTYMLMYKEATGRAVIHEMESDGTIGDLIIDESNWTQYWSTFTAYEVDGKPFIFMTKASTGLVKIYELNTTGRYVGRLGTRTYSTSWTTGWDDAQVTYTKDQGTVMWLRKSATGRHDIHPMNTSGTFNSRIDRRSWTQGWTTARPITLYGEPYLFLNKESNKQTYISKLNDSGIHTKGIYNTNWNKVWTGIDTFQTSQGTFVFLINSTTGAVVVGQVK
ncbi:MAG: hypothetical protein OCD01_19010 [Fibrobacterales bacterium]